MIKKILYPAGKKWFFLSGSKRFFFSGKNRFLFYCMLLMSGGVVNAQADTEYPLIPYPTSLKKGIGSFEITGSTAIVVPDINKFRNEFELLSRLFTSSFGKPLKRVEAPAAPAIYLIYNSSVKQEEGYYLVISPEKVVLEAASPAGMFRGVQTIRQLLPVSIEGASGQPAGKVLYLPAVTIRDAPAFAWRGMHLDVSRHFFSIDYLKKYIDLMALYKLNKFHLHLTDDQGWRIEIKKYPKLTSEGAWRTFNNQDSVCMQRAKDDPDFNIDPAHIITRNGKTLYGGFYTQDQMGDLVEYASARHIDIVPEIDMPGHMMAAINAYGYLSCDGKSVFGEFFSTPICPCLPATYEFAVNVFREIFDIFPGKYIHIGGDEVDRSLWERSTECKVFMEEHKLKNTAALQSYFINYMDSFFNAHGKKLIGWDEILEGGISKNAAVMYWRTWKPEAPVYGARAGNKVIMTPNAPLYFDGRQDKNSLYNVYHYDPVPKGLTEVEAKNILGAQGNTWTEYVPSEQRADYHIMPRLTALAEMLWTRQDKYSSYLKRLNAHYSRLDRLGVHYRFPDLPGIMDRYAFTDQVALEANSPLKELHLRYTTDSTLPTENSTLLTDPLIIEESRFVRLAAFDRHGKRGDVYDIAYQKQSLAAPEDVITSDGLICSWYKNSYSETRFIPDPPPDGSAVVNTIVVPKEAEAPAFALKYRGYIDVPQDGIYSFYLTCDDGAVLKIADRLVVDNDGLHSAQEKNGQVALKRGKHQIKLDFIEGGGGFVLKLQYSLEGSPPADIPADWLKH